MKYESSTKDMTKIKNLQSQGHQVKKSRYVMKGLSPSNAHVKYESSISIGSEVMDKVKVFVHTNSRGMTKALWTFVLPSKK